MNIFQIGQINIDLHEGNIGIMHSGGADSAILLFILMKHLKSTINIYTCSNRVKGRVNSKVALDVIGRCIDLTGNSNVIHHSYFVESQTFDSLFGGSNKFLSHLDYMYTGGTSLPPDDVLKTFKSKSDIYDKRNPNIKRNIYFGKYYAPFFNYNKKDLYHVYKQLGLLDSLYTITRSCEDEILREGHCGKCWWCEERKWAFEKL